MQFFGGRSAAPALAHGLLSVLLGAAVARWLRFVALNVHGVSSPAAEPLKALQSGAFGALPKASAEARPVPRPSRTLQCCFMAMQRCSRAAAMMVLRVSSVRSMKPL